MGLLHDIQGDLLNEKAAVGSALLKLRFLASRLGVPSLESWVQHETEGYPASVTVPDYRVAGVVHYGTFMDMSKIMNDLPIPPFLISKHAGDRWNTMEIRDGLPVIDDMIRRLNEGTQYSINASNLIIPLQGHVFRGTSIIKINGVVDAAAFLKVQSIVRAKALDLTLEIEKTVSSAVDIVIGPKPPPLPPVEVEQVAKAVQNIFNGPVTNITNSGTTGAISVTNTQGDVTALVDALTRSGLSEPEAKELAEIVASEPPASPHEPLGARAKAWLADKAERLGVVGVIEGAKLAIQSFYT